MPSSSHSLNPASAALKTSALQSWSIAVLPGDGIGPEVVAEGVKVLRAVTSKLTGVDFTLMEHAVGAAEFLRNGDPLPESAFRACREADAVLLGAMGLPSVRWPSGKEMTPQIDLRERLDLYNGVRPIRLYHESHTPLKKYRAGEIDFVIVRESTEGLFSARLSKSSADAGEVCDVMRITRKGAERICRAAFRIAQKRRNRLTLQRLDEPEKKISYERADRNFAGDCCYFTQRHFVDRMLDGKPFETSGEEYLKTLAVLEAVYQSTETRSPIELKPS